MPRDRLGQRLEQAARAALSACEGGRLVREALSHRPPGPVRLWAAGKAASAMARGAVEALGPELAGGLVVDKAPPTLPGLRGLTAAHPVPDERSLDAAEALSAEARALPPDGRALLLLSGGASSLLAAPIAGVTLEELREATRALYLAGASIRHINTVRRHLAALAGGRLAALCRGALTVLALSDVIGDDPAAIGSGPASPDPSTLAEARALAQRFRLPPAVERALAAAPETPKPGDPCFARVTFRVLANPRSLLAAARAALVEIGLEPKLRAELVSGDVAAFADELAHEARALRPGQVLVAAGEPTVRVDGPGLGGRAQHLALTMAQRLAGQRLAFVALGSDGSDGPTQAAGARVDGDTWDEAEARGLDPAAALARFDSHPLLSAVAATLITGPTGTNLTDLFLLARPA